MANFRAPSDLPWPTTSSLPSPPPLHLDLTCDPGWSRRRLLNTISKTAYGDIEVHRPVSCSMSPRHICNGRCRCSTCPRPGALQQGSTRILTCFQIALRPSLSFCLHAAPPNPSPLHRCQIKLPLAGAFPEPPQGGVSPLSCLGLAITAEGGASTGGVFFKSRRACSVKVRRLWGWGLLSPQVVLLCLDCECVHQTTSGDRAQSTEPPGLPHLCP